MSSRFTTSPEQVERNRRGAALCREQIAPKQRDEPAPRDESERIHQVARERARGERRPTDPTRPGAVMGAVARQIRSSR